MRPRLERLYIHGYRSFVNFDFRPADKSLLLGDNGSGKSSIFDVLAAMQDLILHNKNVAEAFPSETLSKLNDAKAQRFELEMKVGEHLFLYTLDLAHEEKLDELYIAVETVHRNGALIYTFVGGRVNLMGTAEFTHSPRSSPLAIFDPVLASPLKAFLQSVWVLHLNPGRMSAMAKKEDASWLLRDGSNFAALCRELFTEQPDGMQKARAALQEIVSGFESLRLQTSGRAKILTVKFTASGTSYEIDFDRLSDGQRVLIVLNVLLCTVWQEASLLCLDEIDNFVSIREIQPILIALDELRAERGVQALLISHSSEVIDYYGAESAVFLERSEAGSTRIGTLATDGPLRLSQRMARGWHVD